MTAGTKTLPRIIGESIAKSGIVALVGGIAASIAEDEKYLNSLTNPYLMTFAGGYLLATLIESYRNNK